MLCTMLPRVKNVSNRLIDKTGLVYGLAHVLVRNHVVLYMYMYNEKHHNGAGITPSGI